MFGRDFYPARFFFANPHENVNHRNCWPGWAIPAELFRGGNFRIKSEKLPEKFPEKISERFGHGIPGKILTAEQEKSSRSAWQFLGNCLPGGIDSGRRQKARVRHKATVHGVHPAARNSERIAGRVRCRGQCPLLEQKKKRTALSRPLPSRPFPKIMATDLKLKAPTHRVR